MDAATDVNGGNANITRNETNLQTGTGVPELPDSGTIPNVTIKMEVQEINGDVKDSSKKPASPNIRRKLRKFKANSTFTAESDSTPKTRERKRKLSEYDDASSEESIEFIGFDNDAVDPLQIGGSQILRKLIAEAESAEAILTKRFKGSPKKSLESASWSAEYGLINMKKEKESDKSETESIGVPNSLESEGNTGKPEFSSPKLSHGASPGSGHKTKSVVDMSNPAFKEPFKYGWKRELVFRASSDAGFRRMADIYYYTPKGKKVRSFREVAECLHSKVLTLDNFTFFKEPLGLNDPNKEIIRDAKRSRASGGSGYTPAKKSLAAKKAVSARKSTQESISTPVTPSAPAQTTSTSTRAKSLAKSPKVTTPTSHKPKAPAKRTPQIKIKTEESEMLPPQRSTSTRRSQQVVEKPSPTKTKRLLTPKVQEPCSIRCSTSMGLIPSLQCRVCLCLYHPECVEGKEYTTSGDEYVCKNCQQDTSGSQTSLTPPPLIPISMLGGQGSKAKHQVTLSPPKLQRLPKSDKTDCQSQSTAKYSKVTTEALNSPLMRDKKEGTWLSQVENEFLQSQDGTLPRPAQNIALMAGKRYIVVPKNNAMAVQPAITIKPDKIGDKPPKLQDGTIDAVQSITNPTNSPCSTLTNVSDAKDLENVKETDEARDPENVSPTTIPFNDQEEELLQNIVESSKVEVASTENYSASIETTRSSTDTSNIEYNNIAVIDNDVNIVDNESTEIIVSEIADSNLSSFGLLKKKQNQQEVEQQQHFMVSVCAGYHALLRIFQYLKVQELLRAARVCKMWRDLAAHPSLWKTVRMKNSQVTDWDGLADTLQRRGTQHLDLRKMLVAGESDGIWEKFLIVIPRVTSLLKLELCRCPVVVVEKVIQSCPQLQVLSAMSIKCDSLNLESVGNLKRCQELRLKAISGMSLTEDLTPLQELTQLTQLSLTSVKELGKKKIDILQNLTNLEALELGECSDFPDKFGTTVLIKLKKLERLRLEKGQGSCCTFDILEGVSKLSNLCQMELVNFDVKNGFDKCLANCKNIKRLLIIPTYISQSATSNNMVLGGVTELSNNLTHFVWGVTLELLRVTELFVDQCNLMNKQVTGDSIPVLKPVPCLKLIEDVEDENENQKGEEKQPNLTSPQVDILPLPQLQKLLLTALPKTRVKILKIPFHATWRQSISDTTSQ
ncbi:serine-rich adhesin for platelets isoform X2 [Prorops nasuta]|uniref:serine-rich adhesin for platelets isoform X2 n=1 Tax=Prorops nasuta TaxID=863751 RepID=UPI0034CF0396